MTAVEWLQEKYNKNINIMPGDFDQAKAMEKEQMKETAIHFFPTSLKKEHFEQYYNETYTEKCR